MPCLFYLRDAYSSGRVAHEPNENTVQPHGVFIWLGMRDSNPRIPGPEPGALPLGQSPTGFQFVSIAKSVFLRKRHPERRTL